MLNIVDDDEGASCDAVDEASVAESASKESVANATIIKTSASKASVADAAVTEVSAGEASVAGAAIVKESSSDLSETSVSDDGSKKKIVAVT